MADTPNPDIIYTKVDEAPELASASLLPIIENFASAAGITVGTRNISLEVAINSQDYTTSAVAFTYFEAPVVSELLPPNGIFYGGTSVVVRGSGLLRTWADLQCKFGNTSSSHYDTTRQKWYGDSVVRASYIDGAIRCVTPTSAESGAARLLSITFGAEHSNMTSIP